MSPTSFFSGREVCLAQRKMAMNVETEGERLTSSYRSLEDTLDTDTLIALREPVLSTEEPHNRRVGTLERLRRNKVYGVLATSNSSHTPQYVTADSTEDLIA